MLALVLFTAPAIAGTTVPFTINMSESVNVTGTPRIAVDVGGVTRYATYASGTGTSALTFNYDMVAGDVDLDGVALTSPINLNGGQITDLNGNAISNLTFTPPNTSNVKVNYPSLGMDFTNGASGRYTLNGTVYNSLTSFLTASGGTFTRNSIGTYFDSTGTLQTATANTPRFDYAPITLATKGILIEESRTNLIQRSTEMDNADWGKTNVTVTANATTAPDGTMTAEYVAATGVSNSYIVSFPRPTFSAGNTVTWSIFAKAGTSSIVALECRDNSTYIGTTFNLSTLAITLGSGVTASMTSVGNGWYRLVATRTFTQSSASAFIGTFYIDAYGTGGAGQGVYLWGAQAEIGSFATSYIPTTTAAVTRNTDALTIPSTSWFNASQGNMLLNIDFTNGASTGAQGLAINSTDQGYLIYKQAGTSGLYAFAGAGQTAIGTATSNTLIKTGIAYTSSNANASVNGSLSANITPSALNTPNAFRTYNAFTGHIQKMKYYPIRPTNTQLQLLTQ